MIEYLRIPSERITIISEGVRECFKPVTRSQVETVLAKYNLDEPYFLVVGGTNPRKNHLRLVRAFARLKARGSKPIQLVFCGPFGYRAERTVHEVRSLKLTDSVRFLGYLPDNDLVSLTNGAQALMFVSLYEGFGLPILEAMACETPVITSNVTSMPEVAGDAALLVDPTSEEAIAEAMQQIMTDPKTCRDLIQRGHRQVQKFTWEKAARQHVELYESMC